MNEIFILTIGFLFGILMGASWGVIYLAHKIHSFSTKAWHEFSGTFQSGVSWRYNQKRDEMVKERPGPFGTATWTKRCPFCV